MKEILLLNPAKKRAKKRAAKKRTARKKPAKRRRRTTTTRTVTKVTRNPARRRASGGATMAKRRRRRRAAPRLNPTTRRRRAARRASGAFRGLNFKSAMKNIPLNTLGMFAAKWAAKRFPGTANAATEGNPGSWNYGSYLKGAAGAAVAGWLANMMRAGTGQRVLEGGMSLMLYKLAQNELIQGSGGWWESQLGADESGGSYMPGDVEMNSAGQPYILGEDYEWRPLSGADDYRMTEGGMYGELVAPGPLGDALVPPGPLGASADIDAMYRRSFQRR